MLAPLLLASALVSGDWICLEEPEVKTDYLKDTHHFAFALCNDEEKKKEEEEEEPIDPTEA